MTSPAFSLRIKRQTGRAFGSSINHNLRLTEAGPRVDKERTHLNRTLLGAEGKDEIRALLKEKLVAAADAKDPDRTKRMLRFHRRLSGCGPSSAKTWLANMTPEKREAEFQRMPDRDQHGVHSSGTRTTEMIINASPEYFRPGKREEAGTWDSDRLEAWVKASTDFITETYGAQILNAKLHLDETTPHIHVLLVPLAGLDLSHSKLFGPDDAAMSRLQDSFVPYCERHNLDLVRGEMGSGGIQRTTKEYERMVNAPVRALPAVKSQSVQIITGGNFFSTTTKNEDIVMAKEHRAYVKAVEPYIQRAKKADLLEADNRGLRHELVASKARERKLGRADEGLRAQLAKYRGVPTLDVLTKVYSASRGPASNEYRVFAQREGKPVMVSVFVEPDHQRVGSKKSTTALDLICDIEGWGRTVENSKLAVGKLEGKLAAGEPAQAFAHHLFGMARDMGREVEAKARGTRLEKARATELARASAGHGL